MHLSIAKAGLLKALTYGNGVVEKRTTVPVLSHVLLVASEKKLQVTATDMDMAVVASVAASVQSVGKICVSAGLLYDIVRKLSDKNPITFIQDQEKMQLTIKSGRSVFTLHGLSPDDFPLITQTELTHHFQLKSSQLGHLIDHTRFAIDTNEIRYNLGGICFHIQNNENGPLLRAAATDMHRLACVSVDAPDFAKDIPSIIIGKKAINEIRKLITDNNDAILNVGVSSGRIEISLNNGQGDDHGTEDIIFSSRLVEGTFPDYEDSITIDAQDHFIVNRKDFLEATDRIATLVSSKERAISLRIEGNCGSLTPVGSELGAAVEDFDIDYPKGSKFEVCFNVDYIIDVVKQISSDEVVVYLGGNDGQFLLKPSTDDSKQIYLLMPLIG